jgi:hypothetical protein
LRGAELTEPKQKNDLSGIPSPRAVTGRFGSMHKKTDLNSSISAVDRLGQYIGFPLPLICLLWPFTATIGMP